DGDGDEPVEPAPDGDPATLRRSARSVRLSHRPGRRAPPRWVVGGWAARRLEPESDVMDEGLTSGAGRQRLAAILVGLGVIVFVTGAVQARTAWFVGDALPLLISGGMLGLILAGLGATVFVSAALQGEWRSLDHLEVALRRRAGAPSLSDRRAATTHDTAPGSDGALPMATRIRLEGDRIGGWLLAGLGVAVLLVTSRLVAHEVFAAAQVAYITSGGLDRPDLSPRISGIRPSRSSDSGERRPARRSRPRLQPSASSPAMVSSPPRPERSEASTGVRPAG